MPTEAFSEEATRNVYAEMGQRVSSALQKKQDVILDTLFVTPLGRQIYQDLAEKYDAGFTGIWLDAPLPILKKRVRSRTNDVSEAKEEHVEFFHSLFKPEQMEWPVIDASDTQDITLQRVFHSLKSLHQ
ncbi:MAG: AAA family ATPase [Rhodospirillales bacterium]|nr:AAA family ATPase [Rhodospirillales bacterium]